MSGTTDRVIVQRITTLWTKRTRDAAGRELRARLPIAYPLPDDILVSRSPSVCHAVQRSEGAGYVEQFAIEFAARPAARIGSSTSSAVQLVLDAEHLEVIFDGNESDTGRPTRSPMLPTRLARGQSMTLRFNGRFVGHEDVWYEDKIVQVAFGAARRRDLFTAARPDYPRYHGPPPA